MDAGDTYKKNYNGKTDTKARKEGYATPYTIFKDRNMVKQKLGQWYYISKCIIMIIYPSNRLHALSFPLYPVLHRQNPFLQALPVQIHHIFQIQALPYHKPKT